MERRLRIAGIFLFFLPAVIVAGCEPARAAEGGISDMGAATLFGLSHLTVVYPAGSPEADAARLSAMDRAAYLRAAHGVETRVRADDEISAAELRDDNLLLLGWDNRVFDKPPAVRPFERSERGIKLLGLSHASPDADLLLFHPSPFNSERYLAFWSRIDPELDRFMVLPALGSDWGIFDNFLVVRQGMFEADESWPPRRNEFAEKDHRPDLQPLRVRRVSRTGKHYTVRYDPQELSDDVAGRIVTARELALADAAARLDVKPGRLRITLEVYATSESKRILTGVPDAVHSLPRRHELHMLARHALAANPHEEIHVLAREKLGPCYLTAMFEGLPIAEENAFRGSSLDLHAAILLERGSMPTLEELLAEQRLRSLPQDVSFPAAGLLVRWLRATFGEKRFRRAYELRSGTVDQLASALDRPAAGLDSAFARWLEGLAAGQRSEVAYLKLMAHARDRHLVADYVGVAAAMREALEIKPDDPQALHNLAAAEMRTGEYEAAETHLRRLLELPLERDSRFVILGNLDMGRLLDVQGRREQALEWYRRVLELPDRFDAHLTAREALQTPVTAASLQ